MEEEGKGRDGREKGNRRVGKGIRSHPAAGAVPSALAGLTTGFGMGPGVPPPLVSPTHSLLTRSSRSCLTLPPHTPLPGVVAAHAARHTRARSHRHSPECPRPRSTRSKPSTFSTGPLQMLPPFHLRPIQLVVSQRSYSLLGMGCLIFGCVSHLDAFSGSRLQSWLPGSALGSATGTPALRPPRSSRTRGSARQTPSAHSG